jgi:hypothetical protein
VGTGDAIVGGVWGWGGGGGGAAAAGVEGFVVWMRVGVGIFVGGLGHLREVAAGTGAGVDVAGGEELLEGGAVGGQALGLGEHGRLPGDAEPGEVFEHGGDEFGARALRVEVFVAEKEGAVVRAGAGESGPKRCRVAEVEQAGGGGCEASNVGSAHASDDRRSASERAESFGDGTVRAVVGLRASSGSFDSALRASVRMTGALPGRPDWPADLVS